MHKLRKDRGNFFAKTCSHFLWGTLRNFDFSQCCIFWTDQDTWKQFSAIIMWGSNDNIRLFQTFKKPHPFRLTATPLQLFKLYPHMRYIKMEGFFTLSSINVIVLALDHFVTWKLRSNPKWDFQIEWGRMRFCLYFWHCTYTM